MIGGDEFGGDGTGQGEPGGVERPRPVAVRSGEPGEVVAQVGTVGGGGDGQGQEGFGLERAAELLGESAHLGGVADRLVAILKGGEPYKLDRAALARRDVRAAE